MKDERELIKSALKILDDIPNNLSPAFDGLIGDARNCLSQALWVSDFYNDKIISIQDAVSADAEKR